MKDDEESSERRAMIDWLVTLPLDYDVAWCSNHLWADKPYGTNWVDVNIPEFEELVHWNWSFTIVEPDDPDSGELVLHVDYDLAGPGGVPEGMTPLPGWSHELISAALATWVANNTDRSDIYFGWNPNAGPSEMYLAAQEALAELVDNPSSKVLLGMTDDGKEVYVSSQVMDLLLALPEDERAKLTGATMSTFNEISDGLNG